MTAPGARRDRSDIPRDWWRVLLRASVEVLALGFVCAFFGRFYVAVLAVALATLALVELATIWVQHRTRVRDGFRLSTAWVCGGLLGFLIVWYLTLMPDF